MSQAKPRRGRPKGSGIDDSSRLRSIAALLASEPGLRPTTAIKRIGVSDPSVIRRLRDKFHACRAELMAELRAASQPASKIAEGRARIESASPPAKAVPAASAVACATAGESSCVRQSAPIEAAPAVSKPASAMAARKPSPRRAELPRHDLEAWLTTMCGLSFQAASQAFETQLTLLAQFVRLPQVAMIMRQQVAFNDYALALSDSGPRSRPH